VSVAPDRLQRRTATALLALTNMLPVRPLSSVAGQPGAIESPVAAPVGDAAEKSMDLLCVRKSTLVWAHAALSAAANSQPVRTLPILMVRIHKSKAEYRKLALSLRLYGPGRDENPASRS